MTDADPTPKRPKPHPPSRAARNFGIVLATALVVLVGAITAARFAVLSPQVRSFIERQVDGRKIGRFGRLHVEGLEGDLWREFSLRRLSISDAKGVWLDAYGLTLNWRPSSLVQRRFDADRIEARRLRLLRRPTLGPKTSDAGSPVTVRISALAARVEMEPGFSYRRGAYDLTGDLLIRRRNGGQTGHLSAKSLMHAGDHLEATFELGRKRPLLVLIDAEEANGGALAGALGLAPDRPFKMDVEARGKMAAGRFKATAISGEDRPLQAQGAWSEQGGQADGRISLAASSLTRGLAARFGEELSFTIYGRKTAGELYALDGKVTADNLSLTARGQGDVGERRTGPAGVAMTLAVGDLGRLSGREGLGAGRLQGVLKGERGKLAFTGEVSVAGAQTGAYSLTRVSGPVRLSQDGKDLRGEVRLVGAGGAGKGFAAALLGAAPRLEATVERFANGRLLLRDLKVDGAGLKVSASGGRTLIGALSFKGTAELSGLERARPGAAGGLKADWAADQGRAQGPWNFTLDAKGERLALGVAELDRLLGGAPILKARAGLEGRRLSVAEASVNGAALRLKTSGLVDEAGGLGFKLDWSADGPFRAGPVEIAGKAAGQGSIGGNLGAPTADLDADFDEIDVPRLPLRRAHLDLTFARGAEGFSGRAALAATSQYGPATARTAFAFPKGGVDLTDLAVDAGGATASGAMSLRNRSPSSADLLVAVRQGAFLEGGKVAGRVRIVSSGGEARADLDLAAENALFPGKRVGVREGRLTAAGPLSRLPYALTAEGSSRRGKWSVGGKGLYLGDRATFEGVGKLGRRELRTVETAEFTFGGGQRGARLKLAGSSGGRIDLDASMGGGAAAVQATAVGLDMGFLNEDLTGRFDADLDLKGRGGALDGRLDARLDGARGRGSDPATGLNGVLQARLAGDSLTLKAEGSNAQGLVSNADIVLPVEASASPFRIAIARKRPMQGRFYADGEVRPLWDLLTTGERALSGHVRLEGTLGGSLADPQIRGQTAVSDGRFQDAATGLELRDVALAATFDGPSISVTSARGVDGHGGTVSGDGRIVLSREGASSFKLRLDRFRLLDNDQATASASGVATINRGADGKMQLAGDLRVDQADVAADPPTPSGVTAMEVIERNKPVSLETSVAQPAARGPGMALDVTLKAPRRVYLRGRGLDLEFSLDAHVGGTTSRPILTGEARVVRGDYDFAGKRFEFDPRGVVYLATQARQIRLNLTATRSDTSLVAVVKIGGTAAKPEITLTSSPTLPSDEVLSQVLFGVSASQLSPLEAAQLASALSALAGGGGFDVIGGLRNFAGLDRLALAGGGESALSVSGGKYLTDDVYLELTGGGRDGASAQVEWRVRNNLSIISKIGGQGAAKLAIRWRKDY